MRMMHHIVMLVGVMLLFTSIAHAELIQLDNNLAVDNEQNTLVAGDVRVESDLDVDVDGANGILVTLDDERQETVSIMPDEAIARAEVATGGSCNGCEVELTEETYEGEERIVYEVDTKRPVQLLGFIDSSLEVEASVDAQTGEVLDVERSWWYFLARDSRIEGSVDTRGSVSEGTNDAGSSGSGSSGY